jgi:ABC-type enterochelin transport system substrate-binding protein
MAKNGNSEVTETKKLSDVDVGKQIAPLFDEYDKAAGIIAKAEKALEAAKEARSKHALAILVLLQANGKGMTVKRNGEVLVGIIHKDDEGNPTRAFFRPRGDSSVFEL